MKRFFDVVVAVVFLNILCIPMCLLALLIKLTSRGPILYWSNRVGNNNAIFKMPKFRTMYLSAPDVATHLLDNPKHYLTPIGGAMRKLSLDELPQLWSVLKGDMSFVGPRPALYNQNDLIHLRTEKGVHRMIPGITGWAQINGRDRLPIPVKAGLDEYYLRNKSFSLDLKILWSTFMKVITKEGVSH